MVSSRKPKSAGKKIATPKKPIVRPVKNTTRTQSKPNKQTLKPSTPVRTIQGLPKIVQVTTVTVAKQQQPVQMQAPERRMAVDRIEGDTVIGDLIVVFPGTRETLMRHGLKLDVDEAGDIFMSLDAFSAIHGLRIDSLIRELVEVSRQPRPLPQVQKPASSPALQLAPPAPAT